jgi:hypothetical protein
MIVWPKITENMLLKPHSCGRLFKVNPASVTYTHCAGIHCALHCIHNKTAPFLYSCRRDLLRLRWTQLPSSLFHCFIINTNNEYRSMYMCTVTVGWSYIQFSITWDDCWNKFNRLSFRFCFPNGLRLHAVHRILILEVSKSHTTYNSR